MRALAFKAIGILFLLGLLAAYLFRDDIFQTLQDPGEPFQTYAKPVAPEYGADEAWISRPDLSVDPATLPVKGDVFVVVPEVYKGSEHWNLPTDDARRRDKLERIVRPNYVAPYGEAGRLFAPLYRQAALYAFLNNREDSRKAQDLAYQDVRRAFDAFLAANPPERPIVLVGHGQGAAHAIRLLDRYGERIAPRLAAAYIIDHPLPVEALNGLPVCNDASQTGCVVAWTSVMPGERTRPARIRERTLVWMGGDYRETQGRELVCVNPLSWRANEEVVAATEHRGGVGAIGFEPGVRPTVHSAQVSAKCEDGLLRLSQPKIRSLRRPRRIGGKFRTLPSNLFYRDLEENAVQRVEALIASGVLPKRAPVLEPLEVEDVGVEPVVVQ